MPRNEILVQALKEVSTTIQSLQRLRSQLLEIAESEGLNDALVQHVAGTIEEDGSVQMKPPPTSYEDDRDQT